MSLVQKITSVGGKLIAHLQGGGQEGVPSNSDLGIGKRVTDAALFDGSAETSLSAPMVGAGAVVEYGTNSDGEYVMWENGFMWVKKGPYAVSSDGNAQFGSVNFPASFVADESYTYSVNARRAGDGGFGALSFGHRNQSDLEAGRIFRFTVRMGGSRWTNQSVPDFVVQAFGRWK